MNKGITFDPPLDQVPIEYVWEFIIGDLVKPICIGRSIAPTYVDAVVKFMYTTDATVSYTHEAFLLHDLNFDWKIATCKVEQYTWSPSIYIKPESNPQLRPDIYPVWNN